jgi:Porin subfamily
VFGGASSATGSALETTKTWGFRGAFVHNWNPYWNSALYGAYAQVMYSDAGKTLVCASSTLAPMLTAGSTCNPDFSVGQIGLITRWTPVKNLTFSADMTYTHLDQKFSGSINARQSLLLPSRRLCTSSRTRTA